MDETYKVVSINRDLFLGSYTDAQKSERIPETVTFVVGVISTVGLPQLILSVYYGVATLVAVAVVNLIGAVVGLAVYRHLPYRFPHCLDAAGASRRPPRRDGRIAARRARH
jgi:hypothetical protein